MRHVIFFLGGAAALSWQILWHLDLSLALGASAQGAALTLAAVMVGLGIGALWAGRRWQSLSDGAAWRMLATLEFASAVLGLLPRTLEMGMGALEDSLTSLPPVAASLVTIFILGVVIGPACFCMGATMPLLGLISRASGARVSGGYAANTFGAAFGALMGAHVLLPLLGRAGSALATGGMELLAGLLGLWMAKSDSLAEQDHPIEPKHTSSAPRSALLLAFLTGFVVFGLEVAWFRMLRAAWLSTADAFAAMLACILIALAFGSWASRKVTLTPAGVGVVLCFGAASVWIGTLFLERLDGWTALSGSYAIRSLVRGGQALIFIGPAGALMGMILPLLFDKHSNSRSWAALYGFNCVGCVMGSVFVGWYLLGEVGPITSTWILGLIAAITGVWMLPRTDENWRTLAVIALSLVGGAAWMLDSGVGVSRIAGSAAALKKPHRVIAHINGPDVTTAVADVEGGHRVLFIDGYGATAEAGELTGYMWQMGRQPMELHGKAGAALVICFGTGQTARAVLDAGATRVDLVDINPAVFETARLFASNKDVLSDPRVAAQVMDGRKWLRRTRTTYDVITLEPMPPSFAGSNSLYSIEFYRLARERMSNGGVLAQWFPLHLLTPTQAKQVAAAFVDVFPNAVLWIDPNGKDPSGLLQQGILLGRKGQEPWPSASNVLLTPDLLKNYSTKVDPVTDNNQALEHGSDSLQRIDFAKRNLVRENWRDLQRVAPDAVELILTKK
ncbi:MAG: hypothetical protein JNJ83_07515 [Verrucomicrobiaceae bacterium]|nr:hypothetical protein [Verrucomicrobiaceae bacterium]